MTNFYAYSIIFITEGIIILNFKFNAKITKLLLALVIISFFTPFFSVSCNAGDGGVNFSGFELSVGKDIGKYRQNGNALGFVLIGPSAALLALSFYIYETKKDTLYDIYKTALFIAPIFDIFAVFIVKYYFKSELAKSLARANFGNIPVIFGIKPGFVLYMLLNAAVFAFAAANYFIKRE